jgi:hypothetical protein
MNNNEENKETETKTPDENSGVNVDEFFKIYDPETGEVFEAKRG